MQNVGVHFETWNAGVLGPVSLSGLNEGRRDLSWQKWFYKVNFFSFSSYFMTSALCLSMWKIYFTASLQIGLEGEGFGLHSVTLSSSVEWVRESLIAQNQPLTWYRVSVKLFLIA